MKVDLFDFDLPKDLIADRPAQPRDSARLLVVDGMAVEHRRVRDLPGLLRPGDLLVYNDTRVIPARLRGKRGEARVEVTLHQRAGDLTWRAFAKPAKRLRPGDTIAFDDGFGADVIARGEGGEVTLAFHCAAGDFDAALERSGEMPLPPYIAAQRPVDERDRDDYQTLFAERKGAVAAPTAGLHFTPRLMDAIAARGVATARVTLHVGAGTFLPVKADDTDDHVMHSEWGAVDADTAAAVNAAHAAGGRVVAVGTTSLRLLESAADDDGTVRPFAGDTDLFITPGYRFKTVDLLMTNFHLPRSTLFMLVCAFAGTDAMKHVYAVAKAERYRFYSYGDASLLTRRDKP